MTISLGCIMTKSKDKDKRRLDKGVFLYSFLKI